MREKEIDLLIETYRIILGCENLLKEYCPCDVCAFLEEYTHKVILITERYHKP